MTQIVPLEDGPNPRTNQLRLRLYPFCLSLFFALLGAAISLAESSASPPFKPAMKPVVAHMKWIARDGAPGNISAIAQSTDGYLWLGTPLGLYRFDGMQFASYPTSPMEEKLPSSDIDALCPDSDGGIWIGYRLAGGISHLGRDGVLTSYNLSNHLGPQSAQKIIVAADRSVWAIGDNRILTLRGNRWVTFGAGHGLPDEGLWSLYIDRHRDIWVSMRQRLFVLHKGDVSFHLYSTQSFIIVDIAEAPDGHIWISDGWRVVRRLNSQSPQSIIPVKGYTRILFEPSGTLWMAQDYRGVSHLQATSGGIDSAKLVTETDLTSEQTNSILRDRDGNIWVGTSRGLDRFQPSALRALSGGRVEYYPSLVADIEKGVWIAALAHSVIHAQGGSLTLHGPVIGSSPITQDDAGRLWLVDPIKDALTRYDRTTVTRTPVPEEVHRAPAQSIGVDYDGAILVSFDEAGLWRFTDRWEQLHDAGLPAQQPLSIFRDAHRHVWLGYPEGRILMRDEYGIHEMTVPRSADLGNVLTFATVDDALWAAGSNGVAFYDRGAFKRVSLQNDVALSGVSGVVQDKTGTVWLNASTGVIRIAAEQVRDLPNNSTGLKSELLDDRQGVEGTAAQVKPTPSAVTDKDGLLWFSTSGEVYSLDPAALSIHKSLPALSIEQVVVNGTPMIDREHHSTSLKVDGIHLREIEIDYIGMDLAAPEKVMYEYMLEGEDKTWRDVGIRRQAFYSHLRPGRYHFHLRATNGGPQPVELSAPFQLTITPAFYQTSWFYVLATGMALAALYLLYLLRVQHLTKRLRERLGERASERIRIARDLHDTLLQSIHGLMLRFHVATQKLPPDDPVRRSLEVALTRADSVYLETRKRVESLRDDVADSADLASLIARRSEDLEIANSMTFRIVETGQRQILKNRVQSELYRIAGEAITNTLHHSSATTAEIIISYGPTELLMRCCDTGVGLPPEVLADGRRPGHWGLIGMRERAVAIEGEFQVWSSPRGGTEIQVRVPARRAYRHPHSRFTWLHRLLEFRRNATGLETLNDPEI